MTRTLGLLGGAALLALTACSDTTTLTTTPARATTATEAAGTSSSTAPTTTTTTTAGSEGNGGDGGGNDGRSLAGRYHDEVFADITTETDITYATAPDLQTGADTDLHLDVYAPADDDLDARPVIVWVHGGGFKAGNKNATTRVAQTWARKGFVSISIDYRLDRGAQCQEAQDAKFTGAELDAERARCAAAILAAQHDTQAVVRWVRAHAGELGVDPDRIVIGGFSAGAVTAVNVATRSDDAGDVGDDLDQSSEVAAVLVASGCSFTPDDIGRDDAPMFLIASENDRAVPYVCTTATVAAAESAGIAVETMYFMGEGTHAKALYEKYHDRVDPQWEAFLAEQLDLR